MNKIQKIKLRDIDDFLSYISTEELKVVELLRRIIFDCIPNCEEKLSYNVPFYCRHSRICFIWPASIPWGAVKKKFVFSQTLGRRFSPKNILKSHYFAESFGGVANIKFKKSA